MAQNGLFDVDFRLDKLSEMGDSLEKLDLVIDWEMFRPILKEVFEKEAKGPGGRPAYDVILMFKILILQRLYNLSDDQTEYQINDRLTFMRFLGLEIQDRVPDAKTIWLFRDNLAKADVAIKLFELFNEKLEMMGLMETQGVIVDATFIEAPKQRNTREENEHIKNGELPPEWTKDDKRTKNKVAQKDTDARWTKKGNQSHYGYKNHVKGTGRHKFIKKYRVTSANVHDSTEMENLVDSTDRLVHGDSAYIGQEDKLPKNIKLMICERAYRNKPLTEEQKASNREKSRVRCRIEHIFGFMTNNFKGLTLRCIGMVRAEFNIGLTNLLYNMFRLETVTRPAS